ncbi:MAG: quinone-interacting membrane-bound oxidoreductase complex subunit QmoC [bacterium]
MAEETVAAIGEQKSPESGETMVIDPDLGFIHEVAELGGESFKKCFQCATCSGVCPISPDEHPFPRKEMVWAIWGMKDQLLKDPDIWLCYQCNDCSDLCPRSGNPGDVLAAVRSLAFKHYAFPSFMGKWLSDIKYLPVLILIPAVFLLFMLGVTGHLGFPEGEIIFKHFFPHPWPLDVIFILASLIAAGCAAAGALRFWNDIRNSPVQRQEGKKPTFGEGIVAAIKEILQHSQFNQCEAGKHRYYSHLLVFYGFLALFATTTFVFLGLYLIGMETPLPLWHPVKILGNLGAIAFLVGCILMAYQRFTISEDEPGQSTYSDWFFLGLMLALGITGIFSQIFRLAGVAVLAYSTYFLHLVAVLMLFLYFPYSKFAHIMYRTIAIIHSKSPAAAQAEVASESSEAA